MMHCTLTTESDLGILSRFDHPTWMLATNVYHLPFGRLRPPPRIAGPQTHSTKAWACLWLDWSI